MEFTTSTNLLRDGLQKAVNVIPTKTTFPILNHILLTTEDNNLSVTATDLEVSLKTTFPVDVKEPGGIALPGKIINDILRQMPDVSLVIKQEENQRVTLKTGFGEYHISGENEKEFPTLPEIDVHDRITVDCKTMMRMIEKTSFAVSVGEIRSSLMGVYLQFLEDEIRSVGTDGHRLVKIVNQSVKPGKNMGGYIVSKKSLDLLMRNAEGKETIEIAFGESYLVLRIGEDTIYSRLLEGIYPDYEKVIPKHNDKRLLVGREQLESSLRRISVFSNKITQQILFSLNADELVLSTQDSDYGKEAKETIPAKFVGDPMMIGFNATYVLDILKHIDAPEVSFNFGGSTAAGLVTPAEQQENEDILMLVMPIKLT